MRTKVRSAVLFGILGCFLLGGESPALADGPKSRFYDFSETVITGEQKVPGLEFILGRAPSQNACDRLEADDFRRCIGEVRDIFRYIPRTEKQRVDVVVMPFGEAGVKELWRLARPLTRGVIHKKANTRLVVHPHPEYWGKKELVRPVHLPRFVEVNRLTKSVVEKNVKALTKAMLSRETPVDLMRTFYHAITRKTESVFREESYLGLVMLSRSMPDDALFPEVVAALDEKYGPSGWGATVVCAPDICHAFDPFTRRPGGQILQVGSKESTKATEHVVKGAAWQANRWTLSHNPGLSGYMELRSSDKILEKTAYAFDPFERRIRVSGRKLPFNEHRKIEAWYFPFDPLQALVSVCPEAVKEKSTSRAELPCVNWMADEMVSPAPAPRIEVRLVEDGTTSESALEEIRKTFFETFLKRRVELAWSLPRNPRPWRLDTFRIVLCMKEGGCESQGEDAMIPWDGGLDEDTIETTAWRTMNRSTMIPITGTPMIYDTLKVYLNGRAIAETTKDGAGYVLQGETLYLDVAAPLHPKSHVFIVYKQSRRGR